MKRTIVLAILALLAGCATAQSATEPPRLQQIAADDLVAAITQAKADNDVVALECWNALNTALPTLNKALPEVKGIASGIQAKRSLKGRIDAGLPPEVLRGCAVLASQERTGFAKDMMSFLGLLR